MLRPLRNRLVAPGTDLLAADMELYVSMEHGNRDLSLLFGPQAVLESEFGIRPMPDTVGQDGG